MKKLKLMMMTLMMCLISMMSFAQEIKHSDLSTATNGECTSYIANDMMKNVIDVIKDLGAVSFLVFILNIFYNSIKEKKDKVKLIKEIKANLSEIQEGLLNEAKNFSNSLLNIDVTTNEYPFYTITPSLYSTKLQLMYVSYHENLKGDDSNYLDDLYFINRKMDLSKDFLLKSLSERNEYYLKACKELSKIVVDEISDLKKIV